MLERTDAGLAADPMLECFSVIEPQSYDSLTEEELMKTLSEKYGGDLEKLKREHAGLKYLMEGSYKNMKLQGFCKKMLTRHSE